MASMRILGAFVAIVAILGATYFVLFSSSELDNARAPEKTEVVLVADEPKKKKKERVLEYDTRYLEPIEKATTTNEEEPIVEEEPEPVEPEIKAYEVGIGRISNSPQSGSLYLCNTPDNTNDIEDREWIRDGLWYPDERLKIDGKVSRKSAEFGYSADGENRVLSGNSLPRHVTGEFAEEIEKYEYIIALPKDPEISSTPSCVSEGMVGMMLSGVPLHGASGDDFDDALASSIFDRCWGHVDESGYHYHGESNCLLSYVRSIESNHDLVGYALDGFGILKSHENGLPVTNEDLDECHGHQHEIEWDGETKDMYHYHLNNEYPYSVGCYKGNPVEI